MVWICISAAGVVWICKIEPPMDQHLYLEILKDELQKSIEHAANECQVNLSQMVFQYNNDPKHTTKTVKQHLQGVPYEVMDWPLQSPDLNPIKHMRALLKRTLNEYETPASGMCELFERITDVW